MANGERLTINLPPAASIPAVCCRFTLNFKVLLRRKNVLGIFFWATLRIFKIRAKGPGGWGEFPRWGGERGFYRAHGEIGDGLVGFSL